MPRTCALLLLAMTSLGARPAALPVEVLPASGGLPPHIVGLFEEPRGFDTSPAGPFVVARLLSVPPLTSRAGRLTPDAPLR
ncbi:MAG: hypothetical protein A3G77_13430 [Acidobacteria bacterium RIFCSPLOWO2_12_FULL_68_19]|nr:MAG: hypothetical protein A3G77_13430 [Acidobacteria bacterium RIFCSPLOWO2_12_FULL_68_19]